MEQAAEVVEFLLHEQASVTAVEVQGGADGGGVGTVRGAEGVVDRVFPKDNKVIISGVNTAAKHQIARRANEQSGIIDLRRDGKNSMYRLARPCVMTFFACIEQVMKENLKEQRALLAS